MYILIILIALIARYKVTSLIVNQLINTEENSNNFLDTDQILVTHVNKTFTDPGYKNIDSRLYLDDVIFNLKNQNWTAEEGSCRNQIFALLLGLQNFTLWAVWDWDTQSSEPQGLLFGNRYQLGNFDQCMNAPWSNKYKELKTKYCLADIVLETTNKTSRSNTNDYFSPYQSALDFIVHHPPHTRPLNELTWGACVPESCGPRTVERLLEIMLGRSHLGAAGIGARIKVTEPCQQYDDHREFDGFFYSFFVVVGFLTSICLICTYFNSRKNELDPIKIRHEIVRAFCLRENASDLLKFHKGGLEILYGIRFLTICLIVLDHQLGIYNAGPTSDGYISDQSAKSPLGHLVLHDDLFVDTFFFLSGFLTLTAIAKFKKFPNPVMIIIKRYIRLTVALAVVVFYVCAVFPYTGSGPLWHRAVTQETDQCRKNWWLNLLMLNNYIDTENICLVISWYIPCDFHFFVLTILLFWLYKYFPKLGFTCFVGVAILSIILPGVVNYMKDLSAVQLFTFEFIVNPRGSKEFHFTYIKSHTRLASYMVGVFAGFIFIKYSTNENTVKITKKWAILGTLAALTLMLIVMVTGSTFLWRSYHPIEGAVYAALNRPAWALGVAIFVLCCSFGHTPIVKGFLSWYPWVPLSRLSYGLYLTHSIIITRNVFVTRNPQHNDYFEILNATVGVIFWGSVAALLLWLLAEAPANRLVTLAMHSRFSRNQKSDKDIKQRQINTNTIVRINNDNFFSKM